MSSPISLTDLQRDAVTELLNMGAGQAAKVLSEMVNGEILLSVPWLDFVARTEMTKLFQDSNTERVTVLRQHFSGSFWGDALVIFPEERSLELVRSVMRDTVPLESMGELEQEALTEIGNIILNACIASICNNFGISLDVSLADFLQADVSDVFLPPPDGKEPAVMFLRMKFSMDNNDIGGYLAFTLDIASATTFLDMVNRFIENGPANP